MLFANRVSVGSNTFYSRVGSLHAYDRSLLSKKISSLCFLGICQLARKIQRVELITDLADSVLFISGSVWQPLLHFLWVLEMTALTGDIS